MGLLKWSMYNTLSYSRRNWNYFIYSSSRSVLLLVSCNSLILADRPFILFYFRLNSSVFSSISSAILSLEWLAFLIDCLLIAAGTLSLVSLWFDLTKTAGVWYCCSISFYSFLVYLFLSVFIIIKYVSCWILWKLCWTYMINSSIWVSTVWPNFYCASR